MCDDNNTYDTSTKKDKVLIFSEAPQQESKRLDDEISSGGVDKNLRRRARVVARELVHGWTREAQISSGSSAGGRSGGFAEAGTGAAGCAGRGCVVVCLVV
jgi:hypothetical protein